MCRYHSAALTGGSAIVSTFYRSSLREAGIDVEADNVAVGIEIGDQAATRGPLKVDF